MTIRLSRNFTLYEMKRSAAAVRLGLDNQPSLRSIGHLRTLCSQVLQPLRDQVGPIHVNSGYRSLEVNRAIGGAPSSQHIRGQAADIECPQLSTLELAHAVQRLGLPFDQLILEYWESGEEASGWVHVSIADRRRGEILTRDALGYRTGLPPSLAMVGG